jgi:hypothetical protein
MILILLFFSSMAARSVALVVGFVYHLSCVEIRARSGTLRVPLFIIAYGQRQNSVKSFTLASVGAQRPSVAAEFSKKPVTSGVGTLCSCPRFIVYATSSP